MPDPYITATEARGQIGHQFIYTRAGDVRQYFIPANPQTADQGDARLKFLTVQRVITIMQASTRAALRAVAPRPTWWGPFLIKRALGPNYAYWQPVMDAFEAMSTDAQGAWNDAALLAGISTITIAYSGIGSVSPGRALWLVARTLYDIGLNVAAGAPGEDNAQAWADYIHPATISNAITINGQVLVIGGQVITLGA